MPPPGSEIVLDSRVQARPRPRSGFHVFKRGFDIVAALICLPIVALISLALLVINPIWNRGPLIFAQTRMGQDCRPFTAYKFRTMHCAESIERGPNDPVETDRITRLGAFLRRSRVDELPQFFNVLIGQMSVIGPRPDFWDHAVHYVETVPGYRLRHAMRPGITGLAQVDNGYAEGVDATVTKTHHDLRYIQAAGLATDWYVLWRTVVVVLTGSGAR